MRWRNRLLAAGLAPVLTIAALELGARLYRSQQGPAPEPLRTEYDPYLGYRLQDGQGVNPQGFRGEPIAVPKPPATFRIFCVGGSSTFGSGVDTRDAYPARLQTVLQAHANRPIEVVNAGVPGYNSQQSLVNVQRRIQPLEPDLVLFLHGNNDVFFANRDPIYQRSAESFEPRPWYPQPFWLQPVLARSTAVQLALWWQMGWQQKEARLDPKGLEAFGTHIAHLVRWSRESGVPIVLLTYPSLWGKALRETAADGSVAATPALAAYLHMSRLTLPAIVDGIGACNQRLRSIAEREHVPLIDLAREIPEDQTLYVDPIHLSPDGCETVAQRVARMLMRSGLCCGGPDT